MRGRRNWFPTMTPKRTIHQLLTEERGATMVEYGLMVALIALVAILSVTVFGVNVNQLFDNQDLLDALI